MAGEVIDGQSATFTFGGETVGGVYQYQFFQGSPTVIRHPSLSASARQYAPAQPDYGTATLQLYRNHADAGQQRMAACQAGRITEPCTLTLEDGRVLTFDAFCETMPLIGGKQSGQTINTSTARIRITGIVQQS